MNSHTITVYRLIGVKYGSGKDLYYFQDAEFTELLCLELNREVKEIKDLVENEYGTFENLMLSDGDYLLTKYYYFEKYVYSKYGKLFDYFTWSNIDEG